MKKKICALLTLAMVAAMLGGCQLLCKHVWTEATCEAPKTCSECGKTEGEALGHDWQAATCEESETCSRCDVKRGDPLGHTWTDATCDTAKTCSVCAAVEGEPLGHSWEEATTEDPQFCTVCQITEGEPLDTDPRFTTAATKQLQGKWVTYVEMDGEMMGIPDLEAVLEMGMYAEFSNVGDMTVSVGVENEEDYRAALTDYIVDSMYAEFATEGYDEEMAQEAAIASLGMTIEEYAAASVEMIDLSQVLGAVEVTMRYYVEGDQLYTALSWSGEFTSEHFEIKDGVLTMESSYLEDPEVPLEWTRVEE